MAARCTAKKHNIVALATKETRTMLATLKETCKFLHYIIKSCTYNILRSFLITFILICSYAQLYILCCLGSLLCLSDVLEKSQSCVQILFSNIEYMPGILKLLESQSVEKQHPSQFHQVQKIKQKLHSLDWLIKLCWLLPLGKLFGIENNYYIAEVEYREGEEEEEDEEEEVSY